MTYGKRGLIVRFIYLLTAMAFFAVRMILGTKPSGKIILCYHGVKDSQKTKFINQMRSLRKRVVASKYFVQRANDFSISITFDDAFENLLSNAIPITTELKIPVTIFIPVGSIGTTPSWLQGTKHPDRHEMVMSVAQIFTLLTNQLVTLGSHTMTHPLLTELSEVEIRKELRLAREMISQITSSQISELALPHGAYNNSIIQIAFEEGYQQIYTLDPIIYGYCPRTITPLVGRFSVSPDEWPIEFYLTINGAYSWLYKWRQWIRKGIF